MENNDHQPKSNPDLEQVYQYLHRLNNDLAHFIKLLIESPSDLTHKWSTLAAEFKPQRCWELKGCAKHDCPAYQSGDYRCWIQAGTMCGGVVQGAFASKYSTCFECEVFHIISMDTLRALYEYIDIIIFHLQNKAAQFHHLAILDQLTGLYNRHYFNEIIEREVAASERRNQPLSITMLDLDDFKKINDDLGHVAGDRFLVQAADLIRKTVRKADIAFRFGGDEFLILTLDLDCISNSSLVERLQRAVTAWNQRNSATWKRTMSFSIGCAECNNASEIQNALKHADRRMYADKARKKQVGGQ